MGAVVSCVVRISGLPPPVLREGERMDSFYQFSMSLDRKLPHRRGRFGCATTGVSIAARLLFICVVRISCVPSLVLRDGECVDSGDQLRSM